MNKVATHHNWTAQEIGKVLKLFAGGWSEAAIGREVGRSTEAVGKKLRRMADGSDTDALEQLTGEDLSNLRRCCQRLEKPLPTALTDRIEDARAALMNLVELILVNKLPVETFRDILSDARYAQVQTLVDAIRSV